LIYFLPQDKKDVIYVSKRWQERFIISLSGILCYAGRKSRKGRAFALPFVFLPLPVRAGIKGWVDL
jgi:hypothetical protein